MDRNKNIGYSLRDNNNLATFPTLCDMSRFAIVLNVTGDIQDRPHGSASICSNMADRSATPVLL